MATKAIISSTLDDKYMWYIPIVMYLWNKLGVNTICFLPGKPIYMNKKFDLIIDTIVKEQLFGSFETFKCPEHKESTYAQCSRIYAACLDLDEDDYLISSDVDMAVFKLPVNDFIFDRFSILGTDLVPKGQYPVCYCGATVKVWRDTFWLRYGALKQEPSALPELVIKTYQECLDELLGHIEAEHFRGNYWGKDQEKLHEQISKVDRFEIPRSNGQNQFALNRLDRDDAFILERDILGAIDFHMPRPGYEDNNFEILFKILQTRFPQDNLQWVRDYQQAYKELL